MFSDARLGLVISVRESGRQRKAWGVSPGSRE